MATDSMSRWTPDQLLDRAQECRFCQSDLKALQKDLPANDDQLDQLFGEAIERQDEVAFTNILLAALDMERPVDARHLAGGAVLLPDPAFLAALTMRSTGDAASALVEAVSRGGMGHEREAAALLMGAKWSSERDEGTASRKLVSRARILCRQAAGNPLAWALLAGLAELIGDDSMKATLGGDDPLWAAARELSEGFIERAGEPVLQLVPEKPEPLRKSGYTVRRAVARVGRNDPCPCGSGKKYKKCCINKDQERLSRSSDIPGVTVEELRRSPERHLTERRLLDMRSYELARLDASLVRSDLHYLLADRLLLYGEADAAVRLFETVGFRPELEDAWEGAVERVTHEARRDLLERLVTVQQSSGIAAEPLELGARLLLADETSEALEMIEQSIRKAIETDNVPALVDMSYDLLNSQVPMLGILVARSVLPITNGFDASMLLEELLTVRDELFLAPTDPFEEVLDYLYLEDAHTDHEESKESTRVRARLEEKRTETIALKNQLAKLQTELERREAASARLPETDAATSEQAVRPVEPEPEVLELRAKVKSLKVDLKQRHTERNSLRNELRTVRQDLAELKNTPVDSPPKEDAVSEADEESMLLEEQFMGSQPVRTPSYPERFRRDLDNAPEHVARQALRLIGKLAAGDGSAFRGSKQLRRRHEVLRQRVGQHHRLLFRLHDDVLEIVALINRRDLERTIKRLE